MNEYLKNSIIKHDSFANLEFNQSKSSKRRKSMFEFFPFENSVKNSNNTSSNEIFEANNNLNSILSRNLKSIYNENKENNISQNNPLFENVNCLIKKNNDSNKYLYYKYSSMKINNKLKKQYRNSISFNSLDKLSFKKDNGKEITFPKYKLEYMTPKNSNNSIKKMFFGSQKNILSSFNKKVNKKRPSKYESLAVNHENNKYDSLFKEKEVKQKKYNSGIMLPKVKKNIRRKSHFSNSNNINTKPLAEQKSPKRTTNRKRNSINKTNKNNISFKKGTKICQKTPKQEPQKGNMKIPTLKQINNSIYKTFFETRIEEIKKQLNDLEKNEVSEMINNLPKNKSEKSKFSNISKFNMKPKNQMVDQEQKDLSTIKMTMIERIEIQKAIENDRYQKKYRKLFLNKNLYDSLDDDEEADEERIYTYYIATNSITVYILDFLVLISSFIELYYMPLYISFYISSFLINNNLLNSLIFYFIDFIYIIDLITGFFRAYHNFEEVLIRRNVDIIINYLTGWFLLDLIQAVPFFTLLNVNMKKSLKNFIGLKNMNLTQFDFGLNYKYFALTLIKALKIFKTFTYNRLYNEIHKFLDKFTFFYEWKGLLSSIAIVFSTLHFCTCFFIFIGKNEFQGWILRNNLQDKTFFDLYISSLYYQMATLTTVGYGDVCPTIDFEFIYGIVILIVGTWASSWILTYISNYIKKNNEKFLDFEEKMKVLNEIKLEYQNLGQNLYDSITRYLNYNKSKNKFNLKFILESLPSSLQNNLIIEIYKPIIMNFHFFKSFENSDFFVKIVTSLKPILSMKDDILIQEGDIIEDIIFIKNGVLTLEIIIDLNNPIQSIESHLEMIGMDYKKTITRHNFTEFMNLNSTNSIFKTNISRQIYNNNYIKKKEIKIIDLRKNEHFGDILMILNEKSPLAVKVKSKRAELFFLQKTEATEISNRYSNIWKRIVNRSLHNMNQIKNLIRKKLFLYVLENNIEINQELKEKYLMDEQYGNNFLKKSKIKKNESNKIIEIISEEEDDSSINKTQTNISNLQINNNKKEGNDNLKENNINNNNDERSIKINNNINDSSDKITSNDEESKESNENNKVNNINIDIYSMQEKDELNDSYNSEKINSEMSLDKEFAMDIKNNNIPMNNLDENNKLFYRDIKTQDNNDYKFSYISDEYNTNVFKLLDRRKSENNFNKNRKNEKTDIKTNDNVSIESASSDKNKKSIKIVKLNKFSDLDTSQSTSFSIKSTYENIDTISKYNYQKNSELREKTKHFILEQLNIETKPNAKSNIQISKTSKNINNILNIKYNINVNNNKLVSKKDSRISVSRINRKSVNNEKQKENRKHHSFIHSIKSRGSLKRRQIKKDESIMDLGNNFYNKINRIKTMKKNMTNTFEEKHEIDTKNTKLSYNKLISKNIEKNKKKFE